MGSVASWAYQTRVKETVRKGASSKLKRAAEKVIKLMEANITQLLSRSHYIQHSQLRTVSVDIPISF